MVGEKCVCKAGWKGPICYEYNGCPAGYALYNSVLVVIIPFLFQYLQFIV